MEHRAAPADCGVHLHNCQRLGLALEYGDVAGGCSYTVDIADDAVRRWLPWLLRIPMVRRRRRSPRPLRPPACTISTSKPRRPIRVSSRAAPAAGSGLPAPAGPGGATSGAGIFPAPLKPPRLHPDCLSQHQVEPLPEPHAVQVTAAMSRSDPRRATSMLSPLSWWPHVVVAALIPAVVGRSLRITRWPFQDVITLTGDYPGAILRNVT